MNDLSKLPTTEGAAKVAAPFHYPDSAMTPLERYQADLKRPDFFHDAAQENAVRHLQRLYDDLVADDRSKSGLLGKLFGLTVIVTCGSARFALATLPVEEYPQLPEMPPVVGELVTNLAAAELSWNSPEILAEY